MSAGRDGDPDCGCFIKRKSKASRKNVMGQVSGKQQVFFQIEVRRPDFPVGANMDATVMTILLKWQPKGN